MQVMTFSPFNAHNQTVHVYPDIINQYYVPSLVPFIFKTQLNVGSMVSYTCRA